MRKLCALVAILSIASPVYAQENVCTQDCPSGQAKVTFADGLAVTCVCVPEGSGMVNNSEIPGDSGVPGPNDA